MGFELSAEICGELNPLLDHVEAVLEVVEHLVLGGEVRGLRPEGPLDVPGGEEGVRLMKAHIGIRVHPHTADTFPAIDQDDLLISGQVAARDGERVESGDAGPDDAHLTPLDVSRRRIQLSHRSPRGLSGSIGLTCRCQRPS